MNIEEENKSKIDWEKIIKDHEKSGLSQSAYCKQHGLDVAKLGYYRNRNKIKQRQIDSNHAEFKSIKISQSTVSEVIKLSLPNGFQCEFSSRIDVLQIKKLIETLLSC